MGRKEVDKTASGVVEEKVECLVETLLFGKHLGKDPSNRNKSDV